MPQVFWYLVEHTQSAAYEQTNFARFLELQEEREGIRVSYESLYRILKAAGISSKRNHRGGETGFPARNGSHFGELPLADTTSFHWFGGGERFALRRFIDDATGQIVALYLRKHECLMEYLGLPRQILTAYGLPMDISGVFFVNTKKQTNWTTKERLADHPLTKTPVRRYR
jgi:hypothetical protein